MSLHTSTRTEQIALLEKDWAENPRWSGVKRGYSASDVVNLRGSLQPQNTLAELGAQKLWKYINGDGYIRLLVRHHQYPIHSSGARTMALQAVSPTADWVLSCDDDLILVDGHGRAHPRRFGIASHLGLWLKHPTIGIGKSRLCGEFRQPGKRRGSSTDLVHKGEVIGKVLRTRVGVKPVFVSVGYGLPLEECVSWALAMTSRFRLPEPIRRADHLSHKSKRV